MAPDIYTTVETANLRGKRVAIDGNHLLYKLMNVAQKEVVNKTDVSMVEPDRNEILKLWYHRVMDAIMMFMERGITPVVIFGWRTSKRKRANKGKTSGKEEKSEG